MEYRRISRNSMESYDLMGCLVVSLNAMHYREYRGISRNSVYYSDVMGRLVVSLSTVGHHGI